MRLSFAGIAAAGAFLLVSVSAFADEKADALLKETIEAFRAAKTLAATATMSMSIGEQKQEGKGEIRLKKPNLGYIHYGQPAQQTIASDGKNLYIVLPDNQYLKQKMDAAGKGLAASGLAPVTLFFGGDNIFGGSLKTAKPTLLPDETIGAIKYRVIELTGTSPAAYKMKLYIAPNKLVTRTVMELTSQGQSIKQTIALENVKINAPLTDTSFAFTLPKGAKLYAPQAGGVTDYDKDLVAIGKPAPAFSLPSPDGNSISLNDAKTGKKAILVNFWFYG